MRFEYRGRNNKGGLEQGVLDAGTRDGVAAELQRRGITPVSVEPEADQSSLQERFENISLFKPKATLDDLIVFCRQMYALAKAGIPIIRTMRGLAETSKSRALSEALDDIADRLEAGTTMATAMQANPEVFSELFVAMVHVGENTGRIDDAFSRLSKILELERETKRRIKQATRYPIFVIVALTAALIIVNFFVIPQFTATFERLGADLPFLTQVLIMTSDFMTTYWPALLGGVVGAVYAFRRWIATEYGRMKWDHYKLRTPILGPILEQIALSRFSRNLATTLSAGMPVTSALSVVADANDNAWIGYHIHEMRSCIERGDSLLRAARESGMFPPLILQMISVGEETGAVDEMLINVADFYDEEVDYSLNRLSESIEPILLVGVAILVLILALGVFLPIWDLGSAAIN
ncbi:MSHA biogenesis protein MshG [Halospina denitrificans]|uniref:MSHA biogenesis protein MshG n=1 Tax=Halospina denitrificans TaxID=332522 RepID=A0A4R7JHM6_9GAMM|nr:type II secretion system F family protein [Halospina denitrificans]TDT36984.1 MSHA biogenesis protein MshG [Halospina denitrificans]